MGWKGRVEVEGSCCRSFVYLKYMRPIFGGTLRVIIMEAEFTCLLFSTWSLENHGLRHPIFWDFFFPTVFFSRFCCRARKEGREGGRKEGSKEASKQARKRVSAGMLTILCFLRGRRCALPRTPSRFSFLFFFNLSRSLKTKPASQFASDWPAKHLTLKHFTEEGPGHKQLLSPKTYPKLKTC